MIENLTIKEARELASIFSAEKKDIQPYEVGKAYLIRTVTHIDIGVVKAVGDKEILLSEASWIADTGRYHDALVSGESKLSEIEPYPDDIIVGRGAVIDATIWKHSLPRKQK